MADFDNLRVTQQAYIGSGGSSDAQLHIWRNDNQEAKILLERAGGAILKLAVTPENNATIGTIGNFPLQLQAAGTPGIYISNDSGKVGIGTSSPKQKLDVQGIVNATQYYKNGTLWKITDDDIDDNTISGKKIKPQSISQDKLDFTIGGSQWVSGSSGSISYSSGNVGIGKSPSFHLDVQGTINATQFNKNGSPWIISRNEIASLAINGDKIDDGAVSDIKIANNAVNRDKIADKSITKEKLAFDISPGGGSSQWQGADGGPISYTKGNVGIGTTTPKSLLEIRKDVSGKLGPVLTLHNSLGVAGAGAAIDFNGYDVGQSPPTARIQSFDDGNFSSHVVFYTKNSGQLTNQLKERLRIQSNGNVGIGIQNPEALLHVFSPNQTFGGNIKLFPTSGKGLDFAYDGGADGLFGFTHYGQEDGQTLFQWQPPNGQLRGLLFITNKGEVRGHLVNTSSKELKENITDFSTQEAIEALAGLNPVKFNYREDKAKEPTVGFIAEDVPELVATSERKGVCALEIAAVLTKVIKEQQHELSLLRERVNSLETKSH